MTENPEKANAELYRRYLEAKKKGWGVVYCGDLFPNELISAGCYSIKLLDRLYSSTKDSESDTKNL